MGLKHPSQLDEAQMRHEFRQLYTELGFEASLQVLYEILKGGEWLSEVIAEEHAKEQGCSCTALSVCRWHSDKPEGML